MSNQTRSQDPTTICLAATDIGFILNILIRYIIYWHFLNLATGNSSERQKRDFTHTPAFHLTCKLWKSLVVMFFVFVPVFCHVSLSSTSTFLPCYSLSWRGLSDCQLAQAWSSFLVWPWQRYSLKQALVQAMVASLFIRLHLCFSPNIEKLRHHATICSSSDSPIKAAGDQSVFWGLITCNCYLISVGTFLSVPGMAFRCFISHNAR